MFSQSHWVEVIARSNIGTGARCRNRVIHPTGAVEGDFTKELQPHLRCGALRLLWAPEAKRNKLSGNAVVTPLRSAVGRIRNAEWTGNAAKG